MSTMPISIAEDEQVLRAYNIAEVDIRSIANTRTGVSTRRSKKNNTTGTMYVTNRRIIYNVDNVSSSVVHGVNNGVNSQQIRIPRAAPFPSSFFSCFQRFSSLKHFLHKFLIAFILPILLQLPDIFYLPCSF